MNFLDLLTMSVNNLWRRKLRTFLTVLGVIIGTASIVVMISLGMGMNKANMEQIEKYGGLTTINVYANENGSSTYYGSEMAVSDGGVSGSGKNEPVRLDDAMIETLKNIPHVSFVSPMLTMSVVAKQGAYICSYLNVVAMEPEAFTQMNIKVGQGSLPRAGDQELKFFYGNTVATNFMNEKTQQYYWETGQVPDVDFMNQPMFVIFDQDAYWQSQNGSGMNVDENGNATVTQPPKKYMIESCGVMAGGVEDWADNSDSVLCDINLFKTYIRLFGIHRVHHIVIVRKRKGIRIFRQEKALVHLYLHVRVDVLHPLHHHICLIFSNGAAGGNDLPVQICQAHFVVVNEIKSPHTATHQRLAHITAHTADAKHGHPGMGQLLHGLFSK